MKKILGLWIITLVLVFLTIGSVSAKKGDLTIKGEVTAMDGTTLTIETNKGDTFRVTAPGDFDMSTVQIGDTVLAKATEGENDTWQAVTLKVIGKSNSDGEDITLEDESAGNHLNGAFCSSENQDKPHPLAIKIAEKYGVSEEWVMEKFCAGNSMGAVMLALKTSQTEGVDVDADTLLEERANGSPWGHIWKDLKVIGNERGGKSLPGLFENDNED